MDALDLLKRKLETVYNLCFLKFIDHIDVNALKNYDEEDQPICSQINQIDSQWTVNLGLELSVNGENSQQTDSQNEDSSQDLGSEAQEGKSGDDTSMSPIYQGGTQQMKVTRRLTMFEPNDQDANLSKLLQLGSNQRNSINRYTTVKRLPTIKQTDISANQTSLTNPLQQSSQNMLGSLIIDDTQHLLETMIQLFDEKHIARAMKISLPAVTFIEGVEVCQYPSKKNDVNQRPVMGGLKRRSKKILLQKNAKFESSHILEEEVVKVQQQYKLPEKSINKQQHKIKDQLRHNQNLALSKLLDQSKQLRLPRPSVITLDSQTEHSISYFQIIDESKTQEAHHSPVQPNTRKQRANKVYKRTPSMSQASWKEYQSQREIEDSCNISEQEYGTVQSNQKIINQVQTSASKKQISSSQKPESSQLSLKSTPTLIALRKSCLAIPVNAKKPKEIRLPTGTLLTLEKDYVDMNLVQCKFEKHSYYLPRSAIYPKLDNSSSQQSSQQSLHSQATMKYLGPPQPMEKQDLSAQNTHFLSFDADQSIEKRMTLREPAITRLEQNQLPIQDIVNLIKIESVSQSFNTQEEPRNRQGFDTITTVTNIMRADSLPFAEVQVRRSTGTQLKMIQRRRQRRLIASESQGGSIE